jgi:ADP-ribose pyrophosphatase YjhB (NUDIX family)
MPTDLYKKEDHLLLAVDCIIFGFDGSRLKALLVKRNLEPGLGKWSLMGGFVKKSESVKEAATRVLNLLTGLTDVYMEELGCFGNVNRDPGGRVVSIAFFALIKINDYSESLMKEHNSKWFETDHLPALIFDHGEMIAQAKEKLKEKSLPIRQDLLCCPASSPCNNYKDSTKPSMRKRWISGILPDGYSSWAF